MGEPNVPAQPTKILEPTGNTIFRIARQVVWTFPKFTDEPTNELDSATITKYLDSTGRTVFVQEREDDPRPETDQPNLEGLANRSNEQGIRFQRLSAENQTRIRSLESNLHPDKYLYKDYLDQQALSLIFEQRVKELDSKKI